MMDKTSQTHQFKSKLSSLATSADGSSKAALDMAIELIEEESTAQWQVGNTLERVKTKLQNHINEHPESEVTDTLQSVVTMIDEEETSNWEQSPPQSL